MKRRLYLATSLFALVLVAFVLTLSSAATASGSTLPTTTPEPRWGVDVSATQFISGTNAEARDISVVVNPTIPNNVLASYDYEQYSSGVSSGFASSTDAGHTWSTSIISGSWGPQQVIPDGTSSLATDGSGTAYYATGVYTTTGAGYYVLTTTNGLAWGAPHEIVFGDNTQNRYRGRIAVDPRTSGLYAGSLYFFWQYQDSVPPYNHGVRMRYSRNGGVSWSGDVQVSDPINDSSFGPSVYVAANGYIYAAWEELDGFLATSDPKLYLDRSTDGGLTWGADHLITGAPIAHIGAPDEKGHEIVINGSASCTEIHVNHFPAIAVSPADPNTVYIAWNDSRWENNYVDCDPTGKFSDIAFTRTGDGGATWSAPVKLNDDAPGVDQWQPALAVGPSGLLGATWLDRRYDPAGYLYDLAYSQSLDGGLTWNPTRRVSDRSNNADNVPDVKNVAELGERQGLAFGPDYAVPSWIDTNRGFRYGLFYTDPATLNACLQQFIDVAAGDPFYSYIRCLACRGIVSGYPDNTFRPGNPVGRGQLAKIVSNASGYNDTPAGQTFEDVTPSSPFYPYVERLASRGLVGGYACGGPGEPCLPPDNRPYFRPNAVATRGQVSKIVAQAAGYLDTPTGQTFEDVPASSAFYLWIERLAVRDIVSGYPCGGPGEPCGTGSKPYFRPANTASRGQTVKIVANSIFTACETPLNK